MTTAMWVLFGLTVLYVVNYVSAAPAARGVPVTRRLAEARRIAASAERNRLRQRIIASRTSRSGRAGRSR